MADSRKYFDEIDNARVGRAKELSDMKSMFGRLAGGYDKAIASKAVAVLTYAHWEGFYNDCVKIYVDFLTSRAGKVRDNSWMLLVGVFKAEFESLRARNHTTEAKHDFVKNLKLKIDCGFEEFEADVILARSNLDFARLTENYRVLDFDLSGFQVSRIRLNKELVGWRHSVAHGDNPDLTSMDVDDHIKFTSELLITVADHFQDAISRRST